MFTIEHVQLKYACPHCQSGVVQGEKPAQPIEKCIAGPGLLAHVMSANIRIMYATNLCRKGD